jgi:hypothetical protein
MISDDKEEKFFVKRFGKGYQTLCFILFIVICSSERKCIWKGSIGVKIHLQSRVLPGDKELAPECVDDVYTQSIL